MLVRLKLSVSPLVALFCSALILLLLAGCGDSTPTTGAAPTPTTPPAPATSPPSATLTTFKGDGYSIGYPHGWKVDRSQQGFVTFSDPNGIAYLSVHVMANPGGLISSANQVDLGLQLFKSKTQHYQKVSIAPTTTIGGEQWDQGAGTGDVTVSGQPAPVTVKAVIASANHPAGSPQTQGFTIAYATAQQVFDLANQGEFQPMVQSFKFVG